MKIINCRNSFEFDEIILVGNNLIINGILTKDDGDFTCEVETKETINAEISQHYKYEIFTDYKKKFKLVRRKKKILFVL